MYKHCRNDSNEIFYIGKGYGNRLHAKSGRNQYWQRIVNKIGYTAEIIKDNLTEEEALRLEISLISELKKDGLCKANFAKGGNGPSGYKWTDQQRDKLSRAKTGVKFSESHRAAIGSAVSGSNNGFYGKKHSKEFIEELKRQNSILSSRGANPMARSVVHINSGKIFKCMKDAADHFNVSWLTVSRHCRRSTKKQDFKYLEDHCGRSSS